MTEINLPVWALLLALLGIAVIAVLAFYAGRMLAQLRRQNDRQHQLITQRNERLQVSIVTIAKAMDQAQCELSEGALRLVVLLDHRVDSQKPNYVAKYPGLHAMYERIKHMPTHEARKQYPKAEIRKLDKEREGYEKELAEAILNDVRQLLKDFA